MTNNTIYDNRWLVTWEEAGITRNLTFEWRGVAEELAKTLRENVDCTEVDLVQLVPEGMQGFRDMSKADFQDDACGSEDISEQWDDICDWCNRRMPVNESGNCCTSCYCVAEGVV